MVTLEEGSMVSGRSDAVYPPPNILVLHLPEYIASNKDVELFKMHNYIKYII